MKYFRLILCVLVFISCFLATSFCYNAPYEEIPPYNYPIISEPPEWLEWLTYLWFFGSSGGGMPQLAFIVEPANNLYWKTETYDIYLGVPRNGISWLKSKKGCYSSPSAGNYGAKYNVSKIVLQGHHEFFLIKPPTEESEINADSIILDPASAGIFEVCKNMYDDYKILLNLKQNAMLYYNAYFTPLEIDPEKIGYVEDVPKEIINQYTQLPYKTLPSEIAEVKDMLYDPNLTVYEQTAKIAKYVMKNIRYDRYWWLNATPWQNEDVAVWTLRNRKGICTHFATTFIVLLRSMNIPARLAIGFAGGINYGNKTYIFTSFAHAWAEVYMPPYGWVPVEVTAPSNETQMPINMENLPLIPFNGNVEPYLHEMYENLLNQQLNQFNLTDLQQLLNNSYNISYWNTSLWNFSYFGNWTPQQWNFSYWNISWDVWNTTYDSFNFTGNYTGSVNNVTDNVTSSENRTESNDTAPDFGNLDLNTTFRSGLLSLGTRKITVLLIILFAILLLLLSSFVTRGKKREVKKLERLPPVRKIKYVDLMRVIRICEQMGKKGKYLEAVLYAYIELASFFRYKFDIKEWSSKTPREFGSSVKKATRIDIAPITYVFEKARYAENVSEKEFFEFLNCLKEVAKEIKAEENA